jgi:hypothetical protein
MESEELKPSKNIASLSHLAVPMKGAVLAMARVFNDFSSQLA